MSSSLLTPEDSSPAVSSTRTTATPQRVLACISCQTRKVKCDRKFPCANCVKARGKCVPAGLIPKQRRRRFPEKELLDRLRRYEDLLRQNNIDFDPLHASSSGERVLNKDNDRHHASPEGDISSESKTVYEAKNVWDAMNQRLRDDDDDDDDFDSNGDDSNRLEMREGNVKKALAQFHPKKDHLFFGVRDENAVLSTLHPGQAQIFRLWQIFLDRVEPLLKIIHVPTMQGRILDAASDLETVPSTLEALMFSIYCVAITSIVDEECIALFGSPKKDLFQIYQFACQQAMIESDILRHGERDSLTALYLYLISVRPETDPRSMASMLGVTIRIAQRIGIDNESANAKCLPLEAELRRRLWWSLVLFDNRLCEMSDQRLTVLGPAWDCKTLLNINDSDIRQEMKIDPANSNEPTEALFAIIRAEMGDFLRHNDFHLDFCNPSLKPIVKVTQQGRKFEGMSLDTLEQSIQDKYLRHCNPENPLHFMTIWNTRGQFAKFRMFEYYSNYTRPSVQRSDAARNVALLQALRILECDTQLQASPLCKGYHWYTAAHFPFTAYLHIIQDLKKRRTDAHALRCWEVLSASFEIRVADIIPGDNPLLRLLGRFILNAWETCEAAAGSLPTLEIPRVVIDLRQRLPDILPNAGTTTEQTTTPNLDNFAWPMPMDFGDDILSFDAENQESAALDFDVDNLDWTMTNWDTNFKPAW